MAYLATKKYGLRALAVCYDFPFMVDLARQNIRTVCDSLGLELRVVKTSNDLERAFMRHHLTSLSATGTTWGQCMFCHYGIAAVLDQTARSEDIPFVLSGVTSNEVWWEPGSRTGILARRLKDVSLADKALFALYQSRAYLKLAEQRRQFPLPGNSRLDVLQAPTGSGGRPRDHQGLRLRRMGSGRHREDPEGRDRLAEARQVLSPGATTACWSRCWTTRTSGSSASRRRACISAA